MLRGREVPRIARRPGCCDSPLEPGGPEGSCNDRVDLAERASHYTLRYERDRVEFDSALELESGGAKYCTELVWRAYLESDVDLFVDRSGLTRVPFLGNAIIILRHFTGHADFEEVLTH